MGRHNQSGKRFRARAARRPLRFWWQPFALLGVTVLLWSHLPVNAVLFEPRVLAPPPEPRAAYVVLAPEEAAQALANMRASWGTSGSAADIELGVFDVLVEQKERGVSRKLVGFEMLERGIARHGYPVYVDGRAAGHVTSGTQTPFVKKAIGMAYVPADAAETDASCHVRSCSSGLPGEPAAPDRQRRNTRWSGRSAASPSAKAWCRRRS